MGVRRDKPQVTLTSRVTDTPPETVGKAFKLLSKASAEESAGTISVTNPLSPEFKDVGIRSEVASGFFRASKAIRNNTATVTHGGLYTPVREEEMPPDIGLRS